MSEHPPPKQIATPREITLTGMLMPWLRDGQPSLINMLGVSPDVFYLPLFAEETQLRSVLARAGVPFDSIKLVDDGPDFLDSIPVEIIVVANLRFTDEGKVRYTEVRR